VPSASTPNFVAMKKSLGEVRECVACQDKKLEELSAGQNQTLLLLSKLDDKLDRVSGQSSHEVDTEAARREAARAFEKEVGARSEKARPSSSGGSKLKVATSPRRSVTRLVSVKRLGA
jgi:hypothetical protein